MHRNPLVNILRIASACVALVLSASAVAIEEAPFTPIESDGQFELRRYAPYVVAETEVEGDFASVGNEAFRRLFGYISGRNEAEQSIAMTAPVEQAPTGRKIAMTAPVEQSAAGGRYRVAFVLPGTFTLATAPRPADPRVYLAERPQRLMAAVRYSGTWSEARYESHLDELRRWIASKGLAAQGEPVFARYNPPMMPWFLRRNEILIAVRRD